MNAEHLLRAQQAMEPWAWIHGLKFQTLRLFTLSDAQMRVLHARGGLLYRYNWPWVRARLALGITPDIYVVRGRGPMVGVRAGLEPSMADYAVVYAAALADLQASHTLWLGVPRDAETLGTLHRTRIEAIKVRVGADAVEAFLEAIHRKHTIPTQAWHYDLLDMIQTEAARTAPARLAEMVAIGFATWQARHVTKYVAPMADYPLHVAIALQLVAAARDANPDLWPAQMRSMGDVELISKFYTADFCARFNFPRIEIMANADAIKLKRIISGL